MVNRGRMQENYAMLEACFTHLQGILCPGMREKEVLEAAQAFLTRSAGCTVAVECCIGAGDHSADPDCLPGDRLLAQGDCLLVDLFPPIRGLYCDMTRVFLLGANPQVEADAANLAGVFADMEQALRPGVSAHVLDISIRQKVQAFAGAHCYRHHTGHGVSRQQVDRPVLAPGSPDVLRAGDVVAVEPGIYRPGWFGLRYENAYLIGQDATTCLNTLPFLLRAGPRQGL